MWDLMRLKTKPNIFDTKIISYILKLFYILNIFKNRISFQPFNGFELDLDEGWW